MAVVSLIGDADVDGLQQLSPGELSAWRAPETLLAVCGSCERGSHGLYTRVYADGRAFAHVARPWLVHREASGRWQLGAVLRSRDGNGVFPFYTHPHPSVGPPAAGWVPVSGWEGAAADLKVISLAPQSTALHLAAALGFESGFWFMVTTCPSLSPLRNTADQTAEQVAHLCGQGLVATSVSWELRWQRWRLLLKARRNGRESARLDSFARWLCVVHEEVWRRILSFV
mmetsp:Transcript_83450/g.194009  ORF Transcript_83450/g.194009 Transcript_83450/m.194009 type:complete len:228 (-) Transcript_83450:222-905(-)